MFSDTKLEKTEYAVVNFDGAFVGSEDDPRVVLYEAGSGVYAGYMGYDSTHNEPMRRKILLELSKQARHVFILSISPYSLLTSLAQALQGESVQDALRKDAFMCGDFARLLGCLRAGTFSADNTIIIVERGGAEHQLKESDICRMLSQHGFADVPIVNEQSAFSMLLDKSGFAHMLADIPELTPKTWAVDGANLVSQLQAIKQSRVPHFVIKPTNGFRANGIVLLTAAQVEMALRWIILKEQPRSAADQAIIAKLADPSIYEGRRCIIQERITPLPMQSEGKTYLPTFRMVVLFKYDPETRRLEASLIDAFTKLPPQPFSGDVSADTLISGHPTLSHVDKDRTRVGNNHTGMNLVTPEELKVIARQKLALPMPEMRKIYIRQSVLVSLAEALNPFLTMSSVAFASNVQGGSTALLSRFHRHMSVANHRIIDKDLVNYAKSNPSVNGAELMLYTILYALQACVLTNDTKYIVPQYFIWLRELLLAFDKTVADNWDNCTLRAHAILTLLNAYPRLFAVLTSWQSMLDFTILITVFAHRDADILGALSNGEEVVAVQNDSPDPEAMRKVVIQARKILASGTALFQEKKHPKALELLQAAQQALLQVACYDALLVTATSNLVSCLRDMGRFQVAIQTVDNLEKVLRENGVTLLDLTKLRVKKADCQQRYELALKSGSDGLKADKAATKLSIIAVAQNKLAEGTGLLKAKQYAKAKPLLQGAQQDFINAKCYEQVLVTATSNLASCLRDMGSVDKAVEVIAALETLLQSENVTDLDLSSIQKKKAACLGTLEEKRQRLKK